MDLQGTSALVTGGASGLGEATARALAGAGARVAVLDRSGDAARAVAGSIGGIACEADVTSEADVTAALDAAAEAHGAPRVVVNCAGIATGARVVGREGPMPLEEFRRTIEVNLIGTFNVMRLAAARMAGLDPLADGERGVSVNTASIAAYEGQVGQAAYSASKGGIVAMSLPVARELARAGIRVNAIAPGIFGTPRLQNLPEEVQTSIAAGIPYPSRLGDPAEFGEAVLFIARTRYLNGECIRLDGATRLAPK